MNFYENLLYNRIHPNGDFYVGSETLCEECAVENGYSRDLLEHGALTKLDEEYLFCEQCNYKEWR